MNEALYWVGVLWVAWIFCNIVVFFLCVWLVRHDVPSFNGFWVHIPDRFMLRLSNAELIAVIMHEHGHRAMGHVWLNLLRLCVFVPVTARQRALQELEADDYVTDPGSLASAIKKTSTHPFDLLRASRLEARRDGHAGSMRPYVRDGRVSTHQ